MHTEDVSTFCRVCEPVCGVIATVADGRIVKIRNNPDHVLSKRHFCKKAMGAVDITYDPDRVIYPMKHTGGAGDFTRIS
jgi:formate dehydrogenase